MQPLVTSIDLQINHFPVRLLIYAKLCGYLWYNLRLWKDGRRFIIVESFDMKIWNRAFGAGIKAVYIQIFREKISDWPIGLITFESRDLGRFSLVSARRLPYPFSCRYVCSFLLKLVSCWVLVGTERRRVLQNDRRKKLYIRLYKKEKLVFVTAKWTRKHFFLL